jgi:hypothetical protein
VRTLHLGELLVRNHVLTPAQRDAVLEAQRQRGGPFGAVAEEMFGVSPQAVEAAWAEQYSEIAPHIDPREKDISQRVLDMINRRQAWQFCILPIEMQGDDLIACTTQEHLVRAIKFAGWRLGHACQFVLTDPVALGEALCSHYPMAGMTPQLVCNRMTVSSR